MFINSIIQLVIFDMSWTINGICTLLFVLGTFIQRMLLIYNYSIKFVDLTSNEAENVNSIKIKLHCKNEL